jgi:Alginate lyase
MNVRQNSLFFFLVFGIFLSIGSGSCIAQTVPRLFTLNPLSVLQVKKDLNKDLFSKAIQDADKALKAEPHSVIDKKQVPPSGDKHDWLSQANYWWPDPKNPRGPYIRHDGVQNPDRKKITDEKYFNEMIDQAEKLAIAYYLTENEAYAAHAAMLIKVWFLDPKTAMHPNLNYAQFVPNKNEGRGEGIVSTRNLPRVLDAIGYLQGSKNWTVTDNAAMHDWVGQFYNWLLTSPNGRDESTKKNNHGSWYSVQVIALALYLDKMTEAKTLLNAQSSRILDQIDPQGLQKYELARTKSFSYSAMNLHALMILGTMAKQMGIDLFGVPTKEHSYLLLATDALMPYDKQHPWPYEQMEEGREDALCPALNYAFGLTKNTKYEDALKRFECKLHAKEFIIQSGI